jgi:hypothetical protein
MLGHGWGEGDSMQMPALVASYGFQDDEPAVVLFLAGGGPRAALVKLETPELNARLAFAIAGGMTGEIVEPGQA